MDRASSEIEENKIGNGFSYWTTGAFRTVHLLH
jgi:hypothetical protein